MATDPPQLSDRDRAVLRDLDRVRLLTGAQIERLHFAGLANANVRGSARRRTMHRLQQQRLVTTLERRVGGVRAGSAGLVYSLDARAQRLRPLWDDGPSSSEERVRRPWAIGWPFVCHTLDVAELYVRLAEADRAGTRRLIDFIIEPASWYAGVKPDAYAITADAGWELHTWLEIDRGTESLPTIRRKLSRYLELAATGDPGPRGVLPSVLVTAPTERRRQQLQDVLTSLPAPAGELIRVQRFADTFQPPVRPPP